MSIPTTEPHPDRTDPVDVGIIGLGRIGVHHAECFGRDQIVAGMDVGEPAREQFTERFDVPTFHPATDRDAFYDAVDAVVVCTPNRFHEEYAVEALDRGVHVLLEKPLGHSLASAERVAASADRSDATCMVGFNNRFATPTRHTIEAIESGELGRVTHVEANYLRAGGAPDGWFTNPEISGGGALIDLGVHAIDLALHVLGHPHVVDATGVTHSTCEAHRERGIEDTAHTFIVTEDWRTIAINASWDAPVDNFSVVIHGTEDRRSFDMLTSDTNTYRAEHRAFERAIAAGDPGDAQNALNVQRAVARVYGEPATTTDTVSIDVETPTTAEVEK